MKKRVYITRQIPEAGVDLLKEKCRVEIFPENRPISRDLLPHIGSATKETRSRMSEMVAKNVIAALEGSVPDNLIP